MRTLIALLALGAMAVPAIAEELFYEPFGYEAGTNLAAHTGSHPGWWPIDTGKPNNHPQTIQAGSLTYAGFVASDGNSTIREGGSEQQQGLTYSFASKGSITTGTVYVGFLVEVHDISTANSTAKYNRVMRAADRGIDGSADWMSSFFSISQDPGEASRYKFGLHGAGTVDEAYTDDSWIAGDPANPFAQGTHLVVWATDLDAEKVMLWVDPDPTATSPGVPDVTVDTDAAAMTSVSLIEYGNYPTFVVDEMRVATDYAHAIGIPEPASIALLALGGLVVLRRRRR